jgi:flagellar biosynthesis protein FlhF
MRIKKFVGATLQDATGQMKSELGTEAIILHTRKVTKGGVLNFLGKEVFEVTAAVDDTVPAGKNSYASMNARMPARSGHGQNQRSKVEAGAVSSEPAFEGIARVAQHFEKRAEQAASLSAIGQRSQNLGEIDSLKDEMKDIKATLREIAGHIKYSNMPALPDVLKRAYETLVEADVDTYIASDLVQSVYISLGENAIDEEDAVERHILSGIAGMFKTAQSLPARRKRTKVVALVGPTGVGKTTTIAKLAAVSKLNEGHSVALISADTYRIGAIEQLHTFAAIADIPMEVVYRPSEMEQALRKFRGKDIVYVDTVGRSHYRRKEIAEVAKFVHAADADEVHLVLGASTQQRTLLESVERFSPAKLNRLIVTKTDEAASFGSLLSLAMKHPVPLSFITTGQGVPDDIVAADPEKLALMVFKGVLPHA